MKLTHLLPIGSYLE